MRINKFLRVSCVLSALAFCYGSLAGGIASATSDNSSQEPIEFARLAFENGEIGTGLIALQRAASQGSLEALLRLGEIHETGDLVPIDRDKSCKNYILATERFQKLDRFHPEAQRLSYAFRRAADCYVTGDGTSDGKPNMTSAGNMLLHSGVVLEDVESLFRLGKLFITGEGIEPNLTIATRFLENAARKRYPPAQALLGSLMWEGKVTKHRPAAGLALLILGMERTIPKDRAWISTLYDEAMLTASDDVEREALALVDKWKAVHATQDGNAIQTVAPLKQNLVIPAPSKSPRRGLQSDFANGEGRITDRTTESHKPASADALPNR